MDFASVMIVIGSVLLGIGAFFLFIHLWDLVNRVERLERMMDNHLSGWHVNRDEDPEQEDETISVDTII